MRPADVMISQDDHGNIIANTYRVNAQDPLLHQILPNLVREIRFRNSTTPEGKNIPAPSPKFLAIHAACAQIAHMSGAAKVLDELYRDDGEQAELSRTSWDMSFDPVGAAFLERALRRIQNGGG